MSGNPDDWVIIDFPETFAKVGPALVRTGKWDPKKTFITDGLALQRACPRTSAPTSTEGMRGTAPGTPDKGEAPEAFDKLYTAAARAADRQTFDAQNFDAVDPLLPGGGGRRLDGRQGHGARSCRTSPARRGKKYTFEQLPEAIKALAERRGHRLRGRVRCRSTSDENGDPTAGVYDIYQFKGGKLE